MDEALIKHINKRTADVIKLIEDSWIAAGAFPEHKDTITQGVSNLYNFTDAFAGEDFGDQLKDGKAGRSPLELRTGALDPALDGFFASFEVAGPVEGAARVRELAGKLIQLAQISESIRVPAQQGKIAARLKQLVKEHVGEKNSFDIAKRLQELADDPDAAGPAEKKAIRSLQKDFE